MDFELSDEQRLIKNTAREFTDRELVERCRENARNHHFDLDIVKKIAAQGYLGANEDTHDEALKVRVLATERGWHRVLLVTSANHMRRASGVFRAQGLEVIPVPCNFL